MNRKAIVITVISIFLLLNMPVVQAQQYRKVQADLKYTNPNANSTIPITQPSAQNMTNYDMTWEDFSDPLRDERLAWWKYEEENMNTSLDMENNIPLNLEGNLSTLSTSGYDGSGFKSRNGLFQNASSVVEPVIYSPNENKTEFNYVPASGSEDELNNLTFSMWFNAKPFFSPSTSVQTSITLVGEENNNLTASLIIHPNDNLQLEYTIKHTGGSVTTTRTDNFTFTHQIWHHFTFTLSFDKVMRIFLDGSELSYEKQDTPLSEFIIDKWIINEPAITYHSSVIDDLRFYGIYASETEILNAYERPKGKTTSSVLPPSKTNITDVTSESTQAFVQYTEFGRQEILSGASVSWWRAPFERMSSNQEIKLSLYRTHSSRLANVTFSSTTDAYGWYDTDIKEIARPKLIYEQTYDSSDKKKYMYTQNISKSFTYNTTKYNETTNNTVETTVNKTFEYNFTYAKVFAPIELNQKYVAVWQVQDDWSAIENNSQTVYVTQSNTGGNDYYRSIWLTDTSSGVDRYDFNGENLPAVNLQTDVLFEYGMADNFAGIICGDKETPDDFFDRKMVDMTKTVEFTEGYENLTISVPFVSQTNVSAQIRAHIWNETGDEIIIPETYHNKTEYLFYSRDLSNYTFSKDKVRIEIYFNTTVKLWLENRFSSHNRSRSTSTVRLQNDELREVGFVPFVTVETTPRKVEGSLPKSIDDVLQRRRRVQKKHNQITIIELGKEILFEITGVQAVIEGSKWATDMTLDALKDIGKFIGDKLSDFADWAWDKLSGLETIGTAIIEVLEWLVRASAWLFMVMLQSQQITFAFILFTITVVLAFKIKNYWVILAREGFDQANEYIVSKVMGALGTISAFLPTDFGKRGGG